MVQVAEVAGWHRKHGDRDFAAHIQRGISVAKKASPELRAALADGTVDGDFAWHAASALSAERVGAGAAEAQRALLKLVGRVGGEELEAVMRGLERRGSKGDVADWDAAVSEERAKFNATKGAERGELDSDLVLVETVDGELKTLGEAEAEGKVKRPGSPESAGTPGSPENPENPESPGSPGGSGEAAKQPRTAEEIDRIEGTDLQGVSELVESIQAKGKPVQGGQRHYKLAKTSDLLKGIGLTGDYFTIKTGVIFKHYGKDPDHALSAADWANISESLANPLVVARYSWKDGDGLIHRPKNSYRIWTEAVINGKYAMVGVEVKSPGKEITVNSVTTVYGDEHISLREKDVIYSRGNGEGIRTLLNGPNPRQYSEPPTSAKSISNPPMEVNPADAPGFAAAQGAGTNRAVELRPAEDGSGAFSTVSHPHLRVTIDGDRKLYVVRGLTLDDFDGTDPAGIAALVAKIESAARASGCGIGFADDGVMAAWDATRRQIRSEAEAAHAVQQNEAKRKAVVERLTQSGLAEGGVVQDKETFDRMLAEKSGQPLEENGVVYGFCDPATKTVYLNPEFFATPEGLETPIHEFGHLGVIACEKVNKPVYDRGMGLAGELLARGTGNGERGTDGIQKLVDFVNETYSDFAPEKRAEELLAQLIGKRGAEALKEETDKTVIERVKAWLVEFWRGFGRALGLGDITPEEAEKMTLEQVADAIRAEMSSGRKFGEKPDELEFTHF